jgi:hypothetical protein
MCRKKNLGCVGTPMRRTTEHKQYLFWTSTISCVHLSKFIWINKNEVTIRRTPPFCLVPTRGAQRQNILLLGLVNPWNTNLAEAVVKDTQVRSHYRMLESFVSTQINQSPIHSYWSVNLRFRRSRRRWRRPKIMIALLFALLFP